MQESRFSLKIYWSCRRGERDSLASQFCFQQCLSESLGIWGSPQYLGEGLGMAAPGIPPAAGDADFQCQPWGCPGLLEDLGANITLHVCRKHCCCCTMVHFELEIPETPGLWPDQGPGPPLIIAIFLWVLKWKKKTKPNIIYNKICSGGKIGHGSAKQKLFSDVFWDSRATACPSCKKTHKITAEELGICHLKLHFLLLLPLHWTFGLTLFLCSSPLISPSPLFFHSCFIPPKVQ